MATCDKADDKADESVCGDKVELRLRGAAGGLQGSGRWALAVEAVDDGQLGQVAEEALCQVVALCTHQEITVFHGPSLQCLLQHSTILPGNA